ncbi:MAG: dockerin type I repeat-containing protein [Lentimicrobiaceae bacterium]|nr:dockerin type I repeat-containing protein [Lentimicrobiaceae bacterium]
MKNNITPLTFCTLLGFFLLMLSPIVIKAQIVSAPAGGLWNNPATWIGGIVPGAGDNVVIASTVSVYPTSQCSNITIQSGGILQNRSSNSYTLFVNGNLNNQGVIQNSTYSLTVNVKGNVNNSGSMTNGTLSFTGTANQQMSSTQPLHVDNFVRTAGSGRILATTNLSFVGTAIDLNSDTLEFTTGTALTIDGGNLTDGVMFRTAMPALQITTDNGTHVNNFTIDSQEARLYGTLLVFGSANTFKHNVINFGTLKSQNNNSYSLTVDGNLTNNGIIENGAYSFTVNISGDLTNNGTWQNYNTVLNGSGIQNLTMTQPYSGTLFTKNNTAGRARALSGLSFVNTEIDLKTDTLEIATASAISLDGGNLRNGVISKSSLPAIQLTGDNNAYVYILTIDAPQTELNGSLFIYGSSNNFKTNVINNATLKSHPSNSYTLTVDGSLINHGVIQNGNYNFTINVSGNLSNNGTWENYNTVLNGSGAQNLAMTQPYSGAYFTKNLSGGRAKATAGLSFSGTQIDFQNDTLEFTTGTTIALDGGNFRNGLIYRTLPSAVQLTAGNDAFVYNLNINAPETTLNGNLFISSGNTFKTHLVNNATLKSNTSNSYTLVVDGNLTNNGVIQNGNYNFTINISGNLSNNGTWQNYSTVLNGNGIQELSMTQAFSGLNFAKTASAGVARAIADVSFNGTKIDFNFDTLEFVTGATLSMTNGYFYRGILYKSTAPVLQINSNGNYFQDVTIDAPQSLLNGNLFIAGGNTFKNNVTNNGTLQNYSNNYYTLTVDGNFTNSGSIKNSNYSLTINISGDISNNGSWKNTQTTLTGANNRSITLFKRFEGTNFTKSVAAGNLTATTDLTFDGTAVDLNGTLLTLPDDGYLSVLNGSFGDAVIAGNDIHFNTLAGYCFSTQFTTDVTLHGVFQAAGGISFDGSIINQGTLRSHSSNYYSFTVAGDLENNGAIMNGVYNFTLTILGDITNNGTWTNYRTTLDGVADQYVYLNNTITGRLLLDANNTGSGNWFGPSGTLVGNPNFSGATGQVLTFLNPVTDAFEGQYYRTGSGGNSRSIFINTPANPARSVTMNFLLEGLYLSGGTMSASLDGNANPVFGSGIADQVTIELHDNSNYSNVLFTREGALLGTDGTVSFIVPGNFSGSYYLAIRHRSGIVTVSANPVSFNTPDINYSFDQPNKAYGNNLVQTIDGYYALYSGDVNQDGVVDVSDMTPVDNEATEFAVGYRNPDVNGDGIIDTIDMTIVDNNAQSFVAVIVP